MFVRILSFDLWQNRRYGAIFWLVVLFIFLIPASIPLLRPGFYHFSDEPHIANLYQMVRGFESGQLPPRWAPDMSYGYGYPLFNFYYPLPFYLGTIFFTFTKSLIISLKLVFLTSILLSAMTAFFWVRKNAKSNLVAFAAATIYVYTPYRAVDLYVRGAIGESFAFIFFPLLLLLVERCIEQRRPRHASFLGVAVALFILSHNLAPILFLPFLSLYAFLYAFLESKNKKELRGRLHPVVVGLILGFGISAFWWLPATMEKNLLVSQTPFNYKDHFPFIKQLIYSPWRYGASNPGIGDDISFQIGFINMFLIILSAFSLIRDSDYRRRFFNLLFLFGIFTSLFFMNIRSSFFWEIFPFSNYIQFPWRLLMLTTFFTTALVIWINFRFKKIAFLLLGIAALLGNFSYFRPSEYFNPDDNYFLTRFFADRVISGKADSSSPAYQNYSEDYLLLPKKTKKRPKELPRAKITSREGRVLSLEEKNAVFYRAEVLSEKDKTLFEVHLYDFPGWQLSIDGRPFPKLTLKPYGNFGFVLGKGKHQVEVKWRETRLRLGADLISLFSLIGGGWLFLRKNKW
jgi:uncharacterized membrane protein